MRSTARDTRNSVIMGHRLKVYCIEERGWSVTVDGQEIGSSLSSAYAAWAVGAAESYRRGRKASSISP
jgi:hypothetical protein